MRRIRTRLALAMAGVAVLTAVIALPLTMVYFERRLPPDTAALVERQLRGGELDGAVELGVLWLLTAGIGAAAAAVVARRIARPLSAVSAAARRVARGELAARPEVPPRALRGGDETAGLLRDFTAMAEALEHLETERRASAAAIAHELRTPLTVLQGRLEAARDGLLRVDDGELDVLLAQTGVLTRLVEDLRTLSLADAGRLTLRRRTVDVAALAATVVTGFRRRADEAGVELVATPPSGVTTSADPERLTQVVANLVGNALRHTPPGGRVTVTADEGVELAVRDTGPGFPPAALATAFDRFTRGDPARSRADDGAGSGLGLAVVRAVVELHGGTVTAANPPGGGALVTVRLP